MYKGISVSRNLTEKPFLMWMIVTHKFRSLINYIFMHQFGKKQTCQHTAPKISDLENYFHLSISLLR